MEIAVLLKLIPHPDSARLDRESLRLDRSGTPVVNPCDEAALETAGRIKDQTGGHLSVFSMTPLLERAAFLRVLAQGADRVWVLRDAAFANADVFVTATVLRRAIDLFLPGFDLIVAGDRSADGQTAQLGPALAELLSVPLVSSARRLSLGADRTLRAERKSAGVCEVVECALPALVTVLQQASESRYPTVASRLAASRRQSSDLRVLSAAELGLTGDSQPIAKTRVTRVARPRPRGYQKLDEGLSAADRLRMMIGGSSPAAGGRAGRTESAVIRERDPDRAAALLLERMVERGIDVG